jgi:pimeloyl-ACP methyl ester carboxylesterase
MAGQDRYWVSSDGLRLHYRDYAADAGAPTILCLPGLSRNCRDFDRLASRLSGDAHILAPSLRGRGLSAYADDPGTYVPDVYVEDILALLRHREISSVVVIGTSLGARLAMLMALRAPGLIVGSVLNDLGPETPADALAGIRSSLATRQGHWPERAAAVASIREINAAIYPGFTNEDWNYFAGNLLRNGDDASVSLDFDPAVSTTYQQAAAPSTQTMWAGFEELASAPVLSIRGQLSALLSVEVQDKMSARASASFTTVTVPAVGHAPTLDEPEAIAAIDRLLGLAAATHRNERLAECEGVRS